MEEVQWVRKVSMNTCVSYSICVVIFEEQNNSLKAGFCILFVCDT